MYTPDLFWLGWGKHHQDNRQELHKWTSTLSQAIKRLFPILLSTRLLCIDEICPEIFQNSKLGIPAQSLVLWPTGCWVENKEDALRYHQLPTSQSMFYCIPASSHAISDLCLGKINSQGHNTSGSFSNISKSYMSSSFRSKGLLEMTLSDLLLYLLAVTRGNESRIIGRFCWSAAWGMMNPWLLNLSTTVRQHPRIMAWAMFSRLKQTYFRIA